MTTRAGVRSGTARKPVSVTLVAKIKMRSDPEIFCSKICSLWPVSAGQQIRVTRVPGAEVLIDSC